MQFRAATKSGKSGAFKEGKSDFFCDLYFHRIEQRYDMVQVVFDLSVDMHIIYFSVL
jgi:hypothetical protein